MRTHSLGERRASSRLLTVLLMIAMAVGLGTAGPAFGRTAPSGALGQGLSPGRATADDSSSPPAVSSGLTAAPGSTTLASGGANAGLPGTGTGRQRGGGPPSILHVQQAGGISGFVLNTSSQPISGITVQLLDAAQNLLAATQTDPFGAYDFFNGFSGGTYVIRVVPPAGFTVQSVSPSAPATASGTNGILITNFNPLIDYANENFVLAASTSIPPPQSGSISGSVIQDVDANGVVDVPPDTGISGVPVLLQNLSGATLASTTTDVNGAWAFSGLSPGTYRVTQVVPSNFTAVGAFPGSGGTAVSATTLQVTISSGASGNNNFLDRATVVSPTVGTISGFVIQDVNQNGVIDTGDVPLAGVTIQLYTQLNVFVAQTTTSSNGAYTFTNVPPGFYQVLQLVPSGLVSEGPNPLAVTAIANVNQGNNNFLDRGVISQQTGTISGSVIQDVGNNGFINIPPDVPIPGVQVLLQTQFGSTLRTAITDVNGAWAFGNLAAGTYRIVQVVPANFTAIAAFPGPGGAALSSSVLQVTISAGGVSGSNNFLDRATVVSPTVGTISGSVIQDVDNNGVINVPPDVPIPGVTVQLFTQLGVFVAQATTNANGAYSFTNVPPGFYQVVQLVPAGLVSVAAVPGVNGFAVPGSTTILDVTVAAGVNASGNNFLDRLPQQFSSISGSVIRDVDTNGIVNVPPDVPIAGVQLLLQTLGGTTLQTTTTDVNGAWTFSNLAPGTYAVVQVVPANFTPVRAFAGRGAVAVSATTFQVTVSGTVPASGNNNFLDRATGVSPTVGTISGFVIQDVDQNGFINIPPDVPLAGVTIQLYTQLNVFVAQTTTSSNGAYAFINVPPGFYQVLQLVPSGLVSEGPNPLAVTAIANVNQGNNNFLDRGVIPPQTGTISGSVIQDVDNNGFVDVPPDRAIPGVQVLLQNLAGQTLQAFTSDVNGAWAFSNLAPGTYRIVQVVPANFTAIVAFPGAGGVAVSPSTLQVTIAAGGVSGNNNFLDRGTVVSPTVGTISGFVFQDLNQNGIIDSGDVPLAGVTIQLYTQLNVFVAQTTTSSNGAYAFINVPPGFYQVLQLVPSGLVSEGPNPLAVTAIANVNQGNNNFLDRGIVTTTTNTISGFAIEDRNLSGSPNNEPALAGMLVVISDRFGNPLASVVTNSTGIFRFINVPAGTFILTARPPAGRISTNAIPGQGGTRLSINSISVTTTPGITNYPGQLFLAGP